MFQELVVKNSGDEIIVKLDKVFKEILKDSLVADNKYLTIFHVSNMAYISIIDYLKRMNKHLYCSDECFIIAFIYISRINKKMPINLWNIHRLLITSVLLSQKYLEDITFKNEHFALIGGIQPLMEINKLEIDFLKMIEFNLYVTSQQFEEYLELLNKI